MDKLIRQMSYLFTILANERLNDLGETTDNIILNLVGECG